MFLGEEHVSEMFFLYSFLGDKKMRRNSPNHQHRQQQLQTGQGNVFAEGKTAPTPSTIDNNRSSESIETLESVRNIEDYEMLLPPHPRVRWVAWLCMNTYFYCNNCYDCNH